MRQDRDEQIKDLQELLGAALERAQLAESRLAELQALQRHTIDMTTSATDRAAIVAILTRAHIPFDASQSWIAVLSSNVRLYFNTDGSLSAPVCHLCAIRSALRAP